MKILVTGSAGFIGGYIVKDLLENGHAVVGLDNYSKYGPIRRDYDSHPNYRLIKGDCKDAPTIRGAMDGCDLVIAGAAMIGGIAYFHSYAYDLLSENERILASTFDAAIDCHKQGSLKRIIVMSSSMVFESTSLFPTPEGEQFKCPPPRSTYGFQKLASEYFALGAREQYGLPYTIVRPFNCVGIGEGRALRDPEIMSGNVKLAMSHVLPDLILKVLSGQDPLHILGDGDQVRCYTHGSDLARGVRLCAESPHAHNEDFNLSTDEKADVRTLAATIWREIHGERPLHLVSDPPFEYDVSFRLPDTSKAKSVLGFQAKVPLKDSVKEVTAWVRDNLASLTTR
jgi:UDP-glucose 4-epimerase